MAKHKRSNKASRFANIPHAVLESPDYISLTPYAVRLLIELVYQYNGFNNGDLCPSITLMKERGFKSSSTLMRVIKELVAKKMIVLTRQGGKNLASLYALTWLSIDECRSKNLEISPTKQVWRNFHLEKQKGW